MVRSAEQLNTSTPFRFLLAHIIVVEVEVPELKLRLARRAHSREHNESTTRCPSNNVCGPAAESTL